MSRYRMVGVFVLPSLPSHYSSRSRHQYQYGVHGNGNGNKMAARIISGQPNGTAASSSSSSLLASNGAPSPSAVETKVIVEDELSAQEIKEKEAADRATQLAIEGTLTLGATICPECRAAGKTSNVITDFANGIEVCDECGLVIGNQLISQETEWRTFESDGHGNKADPDRVGGPEDSSNPEGLGTVIEGDSELGRYQSRDGMNAMQKALMNGQRKIQSLAATLQLNANVISHANETFRRVEEAKAVGHHKMEATLVACLVIACRQAGVPRSLKELCSVADVRKRDVGRAFTKIKAAKLYTKGDLQKAKTASRAHQYMVRFCSLSKLPPSIEKAASHISQQIDKLGFLNSTVAATVAGAAIYLATQLAPDTRWRRTFTQIASVAHISPSTIQKAYSAVYAKRTELVEASFANADVVRALTLSSA